MSDDFAPVETIGELGVLASRVAVLTHLSKMVEGFLAVHRARLSEALGGLHHSVGVSQCEAKLGPTTVAKISWTKPKKLVVLNEQQRVAWVKRHHPTEIVETVRASFDPVSRFHVDPDGTVVDPVTGEVITWVGLPAGGGYPTCRFTPGGRESIAYALRGAFDEIQALESGGP